MEGAGGKLRVDARGGWARARRTGFGGGGGDARCMGGRAPRAGKLGLNPAFAELVFTRAVDPMIAIPASRTAAEGVGVERVARGRGGRQAGASAKGPAPRDAGASVSTRRADWRRSAPNRQSRTAMIVMQGSSFRIV